MSSGRPGNPPPPQTAKPESEEHHSGGKESRRGFKERIRPYIAATQNIDPGECGADKKNRREHQSGDANEWFHDGSG
jgi:hypothetical protein